MSVLVENLSQRSHQMFFFIKEVWRKWKKLTNTAQVICDVADHFFSGFAVHLQSRQNLQVALQVLMDFGSMEWIQRSKIISEQRTWDNDHLSTTTTILGSVFHIYSMKNLLLNNHLWTTATILGSRGSRAYQDIFRGFLIHKAIVVLTYFTKKIIMRKSICG
jgi:hypothetical protein